MLTLRNKELIYSGSQIVSSDTVLNLESDYDCKILGVLDLSNGDNKIIEFTKIDGLYMGRIIVNVDDINYIKDNSFKLILISGKLSEETNSVKLSFDIQKVKTDIKVVSSNEIEELRKKVASLESVIDSIKKGNVLGQLPITNKKFIKPGMIPVALDEDGNFSAEYPFANHVTKVNGQSAVDGAVKIDSGMIKYSNEKSVELVIKELSDIVIQLNELMQVVINNQKEIRNKLDETAIKLETHITNGII